jgi:hypothetical protein
MGSPKALDPCGSLHSLQDMANRTHLQKHGTEGSPQGICNDVGHSGTSSRDVVLQHFNDKA